uniref:Uncharacterized protein n=1 Tax=Ditylum brightwellii TaxID=49249 RepID=A0A7S2E4A4_9STRA|mmetsp:Transcript_12614/g.18881  ORF Transcript_12614/g.18881 Transcript_12614/m.18881 type:complete len:968 (+) Transcript_12614:629-3532(+)
MDLFSLSFAKNYNLTLVDITASVGGEQISMSCSAQQNGNVATHVSVCVTTKHATTLDSDSLEFYTLLHANEIASHFDIVGHGFVARYTGRKAVESTSLLRMVGAPQGMIMNQEESSYFESVIKQFFNHILSFRHQTVQGQQRQQHQYRWLSWQEGEMRRMIGCNDEKMNMMQVLVVNVVHNELVHNSQDSSLNIDGKRLGIVDIGVSVRGTVPPNVDVSDFEDRVNDFFEDSGVILLDLLSNGGGFANEITDDISFEADFNRYAYFTNVASLDTLDPAASAPSMMPVAHPTLQPNPEKSNVGNDGTFIALLYLVLVLLVSVSLLFGCYRVRKDEKESEGTSTYTGTEAAVRFAEKKALNEVECNLGWDDDDGTISTISPSIVTCQKEKKSGILKMILGTLCSQRSTEKTYRNDSIVEEFDWTAKRKSYSSSSQEQTDHSSETHLFSENQVNDGEFLDDDCSTSDTFGPNNLKATIPCDLPALQAPDHGKYVDQRQVELIDALDRAYRRLCQSHSRESLLMRQKVAMHSMPHIFDNLSTADSYNSSLAVRTTNSAIPTSKRQDVKMDRRASFPPTRKPKRHLYSTHPKTQHLALDPGESASVKNKSYSRSRSPVVDPPLVFRSEYIKDNTSVAESLCPSTVACSSTLSDPHVSRRVNVGRSERDDASVVDSVLTRSTMSARSMRRARSFSPASRRAQMGRRRHASFRLPRESHTFSRSRNILDDGSVADSHSLSIDAQSTTSAPPMLSRANSSLSRQIPYSTLPDLNKSSHSRDTMDDASVGNSIGARSAMSAPPLGGKRMQDTSFRRKMGRRSAYSTLTRTRNGAIRTEQPVSRENWLSSFQLPANWSRHGGLVMKSSNQSTTKIEQSLEKKTDSMGFIPIDMDSSQFHDLSFFRDKSSTSLANNRQNSNSQLSTSSLRDDKQEEIRLGRRIFDNGKVPSLRMIIQTAEAQREMGELDKAEGQPEQT